MNARCPFLPAHCRIILIILAFFFCSGATHASAQQVRPNLSGTWKLNLSKSKLAPQHPPRDDRYKIKHLEPRLEMVHEGNIYRYVTDGKQHVANYSPVEGETLAKTYWDGDTLVIEKRQEIGPGGSTWVSRYMLSQDGKSLAVTHHVNQSSFSAAFDESLTYEKQQ
ncbi:MAG: hypothetical protein WBQ76_11685 [Candidatus Korobacteraceae bacterium]